MRALPSHGLPRLGAGAALVAALFVSAPEARARDNVGAAILGGAAAGVLGGVASLGVCWDAADLHGLQSQPYRTDHLAVAVPRGHPLARKRSLRFAQTLAHEHVSLPPNSAVQVMLTAHEHGEADVISCPLERAD